MKLAYLLIVSCVFAAGCGDSSSGYRSLTGPTSGGPSVPVGGYTLTGTIQDSEGRPMPDVTLVLKGPDDVKSVVSDAGGRYSISNVGGALELRISMTGYFEWSTPRYIAADQALNITLWPMVELTPGTVFRGTVRGAPCDPIGWDANAPCQRLFFTAPSAGTLDLVLTWTGASELDMLAAGHYFTPTMPHQIHARVSVIAGVRTEIQINAYYAQEAFDLRVEFEPAL